MNDFGTLFATVNKAAGQVTLTWSLAHLSEVNAKTVVSVTVQRSDFYNENFTTIATSAGDFAGSTYVDTVPAVGEYTYKIIVVVGIAPELVTLQSNPISASTLQTVVLSGTGGSAVNLSWVIGTGNVASSIVERSADSGATWHQTRSISGKLSPVFSEVFSQPGTYQYRVRVLLEQPEVPDALGRDEELVSNVLTFTVNNTGNFSLL
jgi:hypothetical protein